MMTSSLWMLSFLLAAVLIGRSNTWWISRNPPPPRPPRRITFEPINIRTIPIIPAHEITRVVKTLTVRNGGEWGRWAAEIQYCPTGTYASKFRLQVERCSRCDDTAMNGIELFCQRPGNSGSSGIITSGRGRWGTKGATKGCPSEYFLTNFQLQVEGKQWGGDDTAANNLKMECRRLSGGHITEMEGDGTSWGSYGGQTPIGFSWDSYSGCPVGSAICGIQTKVEAPVGSRDDTSLNDVRFYCCT